MLKALIDRFHFYAFRQQRLDLPKPIVVSSSRLDYLDAIEVAHFAKDFLSQCDVYVKPRIQPRLHRRVVAFENACDFNGERSPTALNLQRVTGAYVETSCSSSAEPSDIPSQHRCSRYCPVATQGPS